MNLFINGQSIDLPKNVTIAEALAQYLSEEQQKLSFAVALNSEFVGKEQYSHVQVNDNDSLDVLFPIQGG